MNAWIALPSGVLLTIAAVCVQGDDLDAASCCPAVQAAPAQEALAQAALAETAPAAERAPVDPLVDDWLTRLEGRSKETKTLIANLRYDKIEAMLGDAQRRFGTLHYQAGPPARFAVHFDRLVVDGDRGRKQNRWYIFDGRWLVERLDDEKQFRKYEVIAPDAAPEEADPLALGEGPFAVPLDLNKARMLSRFEVVLIEEAEDDPQNTVHLRLTPHVNRRDDVKQIDLWYDKETLLPSRAATLNVNEIEHIIDLVDIKVDGEVNPSLFDTRAPSETGKRGYLEETRRWEE